MTSERSARLDGAKTGWSRRLPSPGSPDEEAAIVSQELAATTAAPAWAAEAASIAATSGEACCAGTGTEAEPGTDFGRSERGAIMKVWPAKAGGLFRLGAITDLSRPGDGCLRPADLLLWARRWVIAPSGGIPTRTSRIQTSAHHHPNRTRPTDVASTSVKPPVTFSARPLNTRCSRHSIFQC